MHGTVIKEITMCLQIWRWIVT